jgi:exopolyphosphatase/guanosine-5'-triphosphate,3'-diphosphate pyrophosphatase
MPNCLNINIFNNTSIEKTFLINYYIINCIIDYELFYFERMLTKMKRIGVIDVGSNSVRMVITEIYTDGSFSVLEDLKESVRLAADMVDGNKLNEERITKAIHTLKTFKTFCDSVHVNEIFAIATEAVRKAENKNEFILKVKETTNIDIRVLTGDEEAYYDYFGIVNSMSINNSLIMDIGGSSTELVWIQNNELINSISLPIGAVNLTQRFKLEDIISPINEDSLKEYLMTTFKNIPWLFDTNFNAIIGIGGTARNIGKIDRKNKRYALDIHHNYETNVQDVHSIYNSLKSKNLNQRKKIAGLSKDRADLIVGPACAVTTLMNMLKVEKFVVSGKGLREGIVYEYIAKKFTPIDDILDFSLRSVMLSHNVNIPHAENVFRLTSMMFDKLTSLHDLDQSFNNIIKTASMLHDCGISIRYYDHHKHSFYMILNSEINGLSHKDLILSAYTAASHRNNEFEMNVFMFNGIINRMDLQNVEKLGAFLRIAESLDKSMSGAVKDIIFTIDDDTVTMKIISDGNIDLEISDAKKAIPFFNDTFDKKLIIV